MPDPTNNPERLKQCPPAFSVRAKRIAAGFGSMIQRYPKDFAKAVRRVPPGTTATDFDPATPAPDLATAWTNSLRPELEHTTGRAVTAVAWLGHNTILARICGLTVLGDPVLMERIGVHVGITTIGPTRLRPLHFGVKDLPPVDLVLISHAHFDHLDRPTLKQLVRAQGGHVDVVTAQHTATLIPRGFRSVRELAWEQSLNVGPLRIEAIRPEHWGARTGYDRHRGYNSYAIRHADDPSRVSPMLFSGDTAMTHAFDGRGPFEVGVFGIGAYDPWIHVHASPEQVWSMAAASGCERILPTHHSTFKLSDEPAEEPMRRLIDAAGESRATVIEAAVGEVVPLVTPGNVGR